MYIKDVCAVSSSLKTLDTEPVFTSVNKTLPTVMALPAQTGGNTCLHQQCLISQEIKTKKP